MTSFTPSASFPPSGFPALARLGHGLEQLCELKARQRRPAPKPSGIVDVTVAVMSYNNAAYVVDTVRSVLAQQGVHLELIVRDDGSTDDSIKVLQQFAADPRFRLERNEHNLGMVANCNRCIDSGSGRYVVVLGSDDIMYPGHLASLVAAMDCHPQAALGYTQCNWIDEQGALIRYADHPGHRKQSYCGQRNEVADLLSYDNYVTPSAMILRRSMLGRIRLPNGGIHDDMPAGDWDLAVRIAEVAPDFVFLRQVSIGYRIHGNQISKGFYASSAPLENHVRILEGVFARGHQDRLRGREGDVAKLLAQRLTGYPAERETALGERARQMLQRLEALRTQVSGLLFSIVLTTYNRPDLLKDALDSIAKQTLRDFEVVLVNDHGQPVERLLDGFDFPIAYLRRASNQGPAAARNAAHRLARGRYIVYLDDDDLFLPEHLRTLAGALEHHPDDVVYSDALFVIEKIEQGARHDIETQRRYQHSHYSRERLLVDNYIPINTFAWPRALLERVGGFDEHLSGLEDWEFLLRLSDCVPFHHVSGETVQVRMRAADDGERRSQQALKDYPSLYRAIYARHPDLGQTEVQAGRTALLARMGVQAHLTVQDWLTARAPTAAQRQAIERYLEQQASRPSLGVLVLDLGGDPGALEKTLRSLDATARHCLDVRIAAFTTAADDDASSAIAGVAVRHVHVDDHIAALNQAVAELDCDWCLLIHAGSRFMAGDHATLAWELSGVPAGTRAVYTDEMIRSGNGSLSALLRPDFNLDLLLALPSLMARHWLFRREAFLAAGGFDPAHADSPEFDLLLRLIDAGGLVGLGHISEPLLVTQPAQVLTRPSEIQALQRHLQHRGYAAARVEAALPGRYRIHYGHTARPGVSILIPTRNQLGMLQRCVESLLEKTAYKNYEVLIVDNGSDAADARTWLDGIEALASPQLRVLRYPQPFNYSAMNNLAARQARGEYLLLLNNDTAIVREDWLDALLNHAQRPEVGIVGAKLLYPDGRIQSAGMILGLHGSVKCPFDGTKLEAPGYMYRLQVDQDYSAVTGACLMVRKSVYEEVGGLDEAAFKVSYNDVDLCLKVHRAGYLVVWTPHAIVLHEGSVSQKQLDTAAAAAKAKRFQDEQNALYRRWLPTIARDRAYNPNLSLNGAAFSVEAETDLLGQPLTCAPLPWHPLPVALALAADQTGCGHYRILQPARAMNDFGVADVRPWARYFTPVELERLAPDVVVLQRQMFADRIAPQQQLARFSRAFRVAELDDYLPKLPYKSAHRNALPRDILKTMRQALALVDRFVVSTDALAEACAGLHPDIRVVENHLPLPWWGDLQGRRRQGRKPRVGWAGGVGHRGDLELIADVVKALADEVDWVFFGMCPEALAPHVHEVIAGVAIDAYPRRLAALDLDLAVAPLEDNLFNQCKSNLRLLEYGACGFPVVCSDVHPYRCDLPVTRVKPRFKDWVEAVRMHVNDLDAAAKAGDALRAAVHRDWMLDEKHARFWLSQWLPD